MGLAKLTEQSLLINVRALDSLENLLKYVSSSNVIHILRMPLQYIDVTTSYAGHVVKVMFQSHCFAHDLLSDTTRLSCNLFNTGENNVIV